MKCGLWRNLAKTFLKCNKIGYILFSLYGITLKRLSGLRNAPIRAVGKKKYYIVRQMENLAFIVIHHNE